MAELDVLMAAINTLYKTCEIYKMLKAKYAD